MFTKAGEVLGELAIMREMHHEVSVRSSAKTELLFVPREVFADLLLAFPYLIFAIWVMAFMAFMGSGFTNLILALIFKGWVEFFRLVRGEMMSEKTQEYVEAARVIGLSRGVIMFRHVLPNTLTSVLVISTIQVANAVMSEAALSFLGLGVPVTTPSLGSSRLYPASHRPPPAEPRTGSNSSDFMDNTKQV